MPSYKPVPKMFLNMLMQHKNFKNSNEAVAAFMMIEGIWKDWVAKHPHISDQATLCKLYADYVNELKGF